MEGAAEGGHAVGHALYAGAHGGCGLVETGTVIFDGEREERAIAAEGHASCGGVGVFGDVLECFEDGEVQRGFDLPGIPAHPVRLDGDRERRLLDLGLERGAQAEVGEQRRIDSAGQVPQFLNGLGCCGFGLREEAGCFLWCAVDHLAGQAEGDPECDQLLLGAVVQVAFQAAAGLVGGGDQALPGCAQVFDQGDVAQYQPGLGGYGLDQPLAGRGQRFPR